MDAYRAATIGGGLMDTRTFTIALGTEAEFIVLQQPLVLLAGEQGIEPQHCMLC